MPSFLFDCGDSNEGPIGFCARVIADTREEALDKLRRALPASHEGCEIEHYGDDDEIEYLTVYFNENQVTLDDSDPSDDEAADGEEEALDLSAEWREHDLKTMLRAEQQDEEK